MKIIKIIDKIIDKVAEATQLPQECNIDYHYDEFMGLSFEAALEIICDVNEKETREFRKYIREKIKKYN